MKYFMRSAALGFVLLVGILAGCASTLIMPPGAAPVEQPAQRFNDAGFSVVPPPGNGWYGMRIGGMISFGKAFSATHTFASDIAVIRVTHQFAHPEDFMQFIEQSKLQDTNPNRFTLLINDYVLDPKVGPYCVKYHQRVEDHHSPVAPGQTLILDDFGVTCLHPDDPHRAVQVEYSERSLSGDITSSVFAEGEAFLSSLQFVPLEKKGN